MFIYTFCLYMGGVERKKLNNKVLLKVAAFEWSAETGVFGSVR